MKWKSMLCKTVFLACTVIALQGIFSTTEAAVPVGIARGNDVTQLAVLYDSEIARQLRWIGGKYYDSNGNLAATIFKRDQYMMFIIPSTRGDGRMLSMTNYEGDGIVGSCRCMVGSGEGGVLKFNLRWNLSGDTEDGFYEHASLWIDDGEELIRGN